MYRKRFLWIYEMLMKMQVVDLMSILHGRNFVAESGVTIHGFYFARRKNVYISPLSAQFLPDHATSKLGLTKKN